MEDDFMEWYSKEHPKPTRQDWGRLQELAHWERTAFHYRKVWDAAINFSKNVKDKTEI